MTTTDPAEGGTMIGAVVLDAFGTIVRINRRMNPYQELIREGRRQGCDLKSAGTQFLMTTKLSLVAVGHLPLTSEARRIKPSAGTGALVS
jgi:hypothetical protein